MPFLPPFPHLRAYAALEFLALPQSVSQSVSQSQAASLPPSQRQERARIGRHEDVGGPPRGPPRDVRERAVVQLPLGGGGQLVRAHIRGPAALLPRVAATALPGARAGRSIPS